MRKLMLFGLFIANISFAGVEVQDGKMSADIAGQPLGQVLQTLKQNTKIQFSIDDQIDSQTVSARFEDLTIAAGIKKILEGTGINYVVMADATGQPTSIFIGKSEKPGAPPKKLDSRPVANMPNRGVVQPMQPIRQPQIQQEDNQQRQGNRQENKPAGMQNTTEVPTGGSLVAPTPQIQPLVNPNVENRANPEEPQDDDDEEEEDE